MGVDDGDGVGVAVGVWVPVGVAENEEPIRGQQPREQGVVQQPLSKGV